MKLWGRSFYYVVLFCCMIFCGSPAVVAADSEIHCSLCKKAMSIDWKFCPYDGARLASATCDQDGVIILYGGSTAWDKAFATSRLSAVGFDIDAKVDVVGERASSEQVEKAVKAAKGIFHRGTRRGISPTFIKWIEEGHRGFIFLRTEFLDEEDANWMRDKLGLIVVPSKSRKLIDGKAAAWFCEGLTLEMGQGYSGYGTRKFHSALKLSSDWDKKMEIDGEVFSAYRRLGNGELIVSSLGEQINGASMVTIFDDSLIRLADNKKAAEKILQWLAGNSETTE